MSPHTSAATQAPFRKNERTFGSEGGYVEIIVILDISASEAYDCQYLSSWPYDVNSSKSDNDNKYTMHSPASGQNIHIVPVRPFITIRSRDYIMSLNRIVYLLQPHLKKCKDKTD